MVFHRNKMRRRVDEKSDEVAEFLTRYPPAVCDLAKRLRRLIQDTMPEAREMLDGANRIVGYGFGSGYADLICTIIPSKKGLKLGIVRGAHLPDPHGFLEGTGRKHRYIALTNATALEKPAVPELLRAAVAEWRKISGKTV